MKIIRTKREITWKIKALAGKSDNFTNDNYGSEACDNGDYRVEFSSYEAEKTLKEFMKWLTEEYNK